MGIGDFIQSVRETYGKDLVNDYLEKNYKPQEMSPEEDAAIQRSLAYPDLRPQPFDGTYRAWLIRVSVWGEFSIKHTDLGPDREFRDKVVGHQVFLDRIEGADEEAGKLSSWKAELPKVNKVVLSRDYVSWDGKKYKESFTIEVKLKSSLQNALDASRKKGLFGWFFK